MGDYDVTTKPVETTSTLPQQTEEQTVEPKKVNYNIGAAMLNNGSIGAGVEAQAERELPIGKRKAEFIDFKASGGAYTNGTRANLYAGIGIKHNTEYKYRPITPEFGLEANYVRDNQNVSFTTEAVNLNGTPISGQSTTIDYKSRNLQFNEKMGLEYATKNGRFTLGGGIKAGVNIPLDDGYKITHDYSSSTEQTTSEGRTIIEKYGYHAVMKKEPETDANFAGYGNVSYKLNKRLSLNLNGEYGNNNKEIRFGAKYNF